MDTLTRFLPTIKALQETSAYQFSSWASASQYLTAYTLVDRYFDRNEAVLDWGAGQGHFTRHLIQEGFQVTPFSIYEDEEFAKVVGQAHASSIVIDNDPVSLPFPEGSFGAATSIGVLEHVRESGGTEAGSLLELHRVLKRGGILLVYHFPNKYSWVEWVAKHVPSKHHHEFRYTSKQIHQLIEDSGFEMIHHERYGVLPRLSLRRFPNQLKLVTILNGFDSIASRVVGTISQNHVVVLRKV
jgi:cyclopropane fatty-acyl-phospholipid synthase-like methyltransferase